MYKFIIIFLLKYMYVQIGRGYFLNRRLTGAGDDQSVSAGLLANKVRRTIATSMAVSGNEALTPHTDTVHIC
jgi:hypothetical protein